MIKLTRKPVIVSFVGVCALAAAVGGCGGGDDGGDTDEAASVARDYLEAVAARDADTACALLTEEALADEFSDTSEGEVDDCVRYIEAIPGEGDEIDEVSVVDESEGGAAIVHATTVVDPEPRVMVLIESDGEWLIDDSSYDSATEPEIE